MPADSVSAPTQNGTVSGTTMYTCGICRDQLDLYKTLPCTHRFCVICLVKYVDHRSEVVCPVCFQTTTLPEGGVGKLPSYFFIDFEKGTHGRYKKTRFATSKLRWNEPAYFSCDHLSGDNVKGEQLPETESAIERRQAELHRMLTDLSVSSNVHDVTSSRDRGFGSCPACQKLVKGFIERKKAIVGAVRDRAGKVRRAVQPTKNSEHASEDIRVLLLGDSGSGKTHLLNRYVDRSDVDPEPTLGVDFRKKELTVDGKHVTLQLWDTSGDARFRSMISRYFAQADAVVLVYDTSHPESVQTWRGIFLQGTSANQNAGHADIIHVKDARAVESLSFLDRMLTSLKMSAEESSKVLRAFLAEIINHLKVTTERAGRKVKGLRWKGEIRRDQGDIEITSDGDPDSPTGVTFMVIGNNRAPDNPEGHKSEVETWCHGNNIRHHVTSSQDATVLENAFMALVRDVRGSRAHAPSEKLHEVELS